MTSLHAAPAPSADTAARRIVSLVPSLTEALFALGAGDRVVGVTRFCEQPAADVATLPRVGGTKNPDLLTIAKLRPDLVIASREENREQDVQALTADGLRVLVTHYPTVRAAMSGIIDLARLAAGNTQLAEAWREQTAGIAAQVAATAVAPPRYFCPIWRNPYMTARRDTYMADLLALAGSVDALNDGGPLHYNAVDLDAAMAARPEIVLLPDEPYRFQPRHRADFAAYRDVPAVAQDRIILVDGKLLTWYGPRTPRALRFFADTFARAQIGVGGAAYG